MTLKLDISKPKISKRNQVTTLRGSTQETTKESNNADSLQTILNKFFQINRMPQLNLITPHIPNSSKVNTSLA
jgi:hypothetical protein